MIKSYWLRLFLFALGGAVIAMGASLLAKPKYEALVDILIDQKPLTASIPLTNADASVSDMLDFNRPRSLTTQLQQLTSYGIVSEAARRVALQSNSPDPMTTPDSPIYPPSLMDSITVSAEASSDIISLRIRLEDPELAKSIAREIYLAFGEQNSKNSTELASRAIDFIRTQYDDIQKQLRAVDAEQEKVKSELGTADINTQLSAEVSALNTLRSTRDAAKFDLVTVRQRGRELRNYLAKLDKQENVGKTESPNPVYQRYEADVASAVAEEQGLLQIYSPENERVLAVRAKINFLKSQMDPKITPKMIRAQSTEGPNNARKQVEAQLAEATGAEMGLVDRLAATEAAVAEKEAFMKKFPGAQAKLNDLNRQQLALERVYQAYADRMKTLEAAKRGRVNPTREVTAAVALPDPVSPKPVVNTLFGIVAGLIFGVLSMLATEAKKQPIRSLAQLNQLAFRPVYRLVPELRAPFRGLSKAPPESYETLLANHLRSTNRPYRIAIVGLSKDAGASTTAVNLAVAGARHGSRVLLVECDPRGSLARLAGKQPSAGEVVDISPLIKGVSVETLLSLSGDRNPEIAAAVRDNEADLTIVDLEPTSKSAEYAFVAPHVDEVILLVRAGRTKSVEFLQAQQALKEAGCAQVTVAFTRSSDLAVVTESADPTLVESSTDPKSLDS